MTNLRLLLCGLLWSNMCGYVVISIILVNVVLLKHPLWIIKECVDQQPTAHDSAEDGKCHFKCVYVNHWCPPSHLPMVLRYASERWAAVAWMPHQIP